jgi:hypothetical protein
MITHLNAEEFLRKLPADQFTHEHGAKANRTDAGTLLAAIDLHDTWTVVGWQFGDSVGLAKDFCPYVVLFENGHGKRVWFHLSKISFQTLAEKVQTKG